LSRVVLDTNVWLALWFFREPGVDELREVLARGDLVPVRSAATDYELAEVLARPNLFNVASDRQAALLREWESLAELVGDIASAPCRCRDPDDQKFLDLALSAGARWLITRDRDLLKLRKKVRSAGLTIAAPAGYPGALPDLSPISPEIRLNPGAGSG
jgi:putative PIN family toxin of toxin-antitoxin system